MSSQPPFGFGYGAFGVNPFSPTPTPLPNPTIGPQYNPSTIDHLTWALDPNTGDICLDASGNSAVYSGAEAIAQDVSTQLSTFLGECWYDTSQGVPYWQQILGKRPPFSLIVSLLEAQALLVPDVETATATITQINTQRGVIGQMTITDSEGESTTIAIGGAQLGILSTQSQSPITIGGTYVEI